MRIFIRLVGFALTLTVLLWVKNRPIDEGSGIRIAVGGVIAGLPIVWVGRAVLDKRPTIERCFWITTFVHYLMMITLGSALIAAIRVAQLSLDRTTLLPPVVGLALMAMTGTVLLFIVINLAVGGLGAPFAIALTRRLAIDWLYAWTRNPMALSALPFLLATGLWLSSMLFVLWVVAIVMPVILVYLKVYEERELEIRFGASYLEYKAKTPMLWPRKPRV